MPHHCPVTVNTVLDPTALVRIAVLVPSDTNSVFLVVDPFTLVYVILVVVQPTFS